MKAFRNLILKYYRNLLITFSARYYSNLDELPIANFSAAMSGDLSKIAKTRKYSESKAFTIWKRLFDEHLKSHGLPETFVEYLKKMVKASDHYSKAYNGQKWQIVKARIYEFEAKQLLTGEGERIETTCARISKFMGFSVLASKCSVNEFYSYIALLKND